MLNLEQIPLAYYSFSALLNFITCFFLASFVLLKNYKSSLNKIFSFFCFAIAQWSIFYFLWLSANNLKLADFYMRTCMIGVIFMPTIFTHFVSVLAHVKNRNLLYVNYALTFFMASSVYSPLYAKEGGAFSVFPYWLLPGIIFPLHLVHFFLNLIYSYFLILSAFKSSKGILKVQIRYVVLGTIIGFLGGWTNYLYWYRIHFFPPIFNITASFGVTFIAYAILKYRLMDINIVLTRAGIFAAVFFPIFFLPFWIAPKFIHTSLWWIPTFMMGILATLGIFIYNFLRKRAEDVILKDQHRYQKALRELSKTMTRFRDLDKLLQAIDLTVIEQVKVSFAGIYLKDEEYRSYKCKHCFPQKERDRFPEFIPLGSNLIKNLFEHKRPLLSDEVGSQDKINFDLGLVVPCFIEDNLLGFLIMGAKPNNQMYTPDDLIVFETLSYSTALAIENSQFWKEIEDRQRKARLQEMDTYSYSLAHEIDNPMYIIIGQAQILQKALLKELNLPEDKQKDLESSLNFILESAWRVSGMVKAIRDFGSPATGEFKPLKVEEVVESFAKLYFPQFKNAGVTFAKELPAQALYIRGEKPELMQVLVILANNSLHAMKYSQTKQITLSVEPSNQDAVKILFKDTGSGIKKDLLPVIFAPFTTTKASSEGTGMGLYNAQKIIIRHKGKIWAESEGENKGTTFFIELPVAAGITPEEFKNEDKGRRLF
jgi:signal transduction histidine kinase